MRECTTQKMHLGFFINYNFLVKLQTFAQHLSLKITNDILYHRQCIEHETCIVIDDIRVKDHTVLFCNKKVFNYFASISFSHILNLACSSQDDLVYSFVYSNTKLFVLTPLMLRNVPSDYPHEYEKYCLFSYSWIIDQQNIHISWHQVFLSTFKTACLYNCL